MATENLNSMGEDKAAAWVPNEEGEVFCVFKIWHLASTPLAFIQIISLCAVCGRESYAVGCLPVHAYF